MPPTPSKLEAGGNELESTGSINACSSAKYFICVLLRKQSEARNSLRLLWKWLARDCALMVSRVHQFPFRISLLFWDPSPRALPFFGVNRISSPRFFALANYW